MGIPLGNRFREIRLVQAYFDKKHEEYLKVKATVLASIGSSERAIEALNEYAKCIWPSDEYNRKMAERNRDIIESESKRVYNVKKVDMQS